jgi:predicted alpha-1,6-mannanase (GH76 family)
VPSDFVSRYVFNKQGFYADYEGFSQNWRAHVVDVLKTAYLRDKAAFRARLYGLTD